MLVERREYTRAEPIMQKILVIDDDDTEVKLIKKYITSLVAEIDTCSTIDRAKELVATNKYDLVLLDVMLGADRSDVRLDELYEIDNNLDIIMLSNQDLDIQRSGHNAIFLNKDRLSVLANLIQIKRSVQDIKAVFNGK